MPVWQLYCITLVLWRNEMSKKYLLKHRPSNKINMTSIEIIRIFILLAIWKYNEQNNFHHNFHLKLRLKVNFIWNPKIDFNSWPDNWLIDK